MHFKAVLHTNCSIVLFGNYGFGFPGLAVSTLMFLKHVLAKHVFANVFEAMKCFYIFSIPPPPGKQRENNKIPLLLQYFHMPHLKGDLNDHFAVHLLARFILKDLNKDDITIDITDSLQDMHVYKTHRLYAFYMHVENR